MAAPERDLRILVVGEGPDDVGVRLRSEPGDMGETGAAVLPVLVERLLGSPRQLTLEKRLLARTHQRGFDRKVKFHIGEASRGGFDGVVIVIDRDRSEGHQRLKELRKGREAAKAEYPTPAALGVAIECLEAWLLGDAQALRQVIGDPSLAQPPSPETLCGRPGAMDHPKAYLMTCLAGDTDQRRGRSERYRAIAQTLDLDVLERTCPRGFKPFADEVRRELGSLVQWGK